MAELAVATTLGLVQIIIPLLSKLNLHADVKLKADIESMRSWLRFIHAYMEDNSGLAKDRRQLLLIERVGRVAYDIEDVVDEFLLHSPPYTFHHNKISRAIHTMAHNFHHSFPQRGVSEKIAKIKKDIKEIRDQNDFSVSRSSSSHSSRPSSSSRVTVSPLLLDDEMVGYENPKLEITKKLLDVREKRLVRIGVDGPPGSGKTTLVKNIFWKKGIQAQFDCHAWIWVSHNPDVEKISENLLRQLCTSRKEAFPVDDGRDLQSRLKAYLTGKKFLIVVDDIWRQEDWIYLKDSLPDSPRGSRIIVTTRHSNLFSVSASSPSHDHVIRLQGLESFNARELFCARAFPDKKCPCELQDISTRIVERCEGLPLAIVAVAGALAQKQQNLYEWERFHNNIGNEIRGSSDFFAINSSLLRSYMDLSSSLKCCFLYMSIFPEDHSVERGRMNRLFPRDHSVERGRLIRLWVAEGFAVGTEYQTAEEVAEDYLNQLIHRNLIHVSNRDFDGRPKNCRVLNIVLKFIIQKSKDENFASIFPKETTSQTQLSGPDQSNLTRRLSVHDHCKHLPEHGDLSSVRSMFLLRLGEGIDSLYSDFEKIHRNLKLIKVLDVQGAPLTEFPKELRRFTLMRYLCFRDTKIKSIPTSIQKLSYLETLDLKQTHVTELPQEISNLHNLRHLFAYKYNVTDYVDFDSVQGVKLQEGICKLTNLQNLSVVNIEQKGKILKDLKALTQLRKLGVTGLRREHGKDLCAAVEAMQSIKTLDITSAAKEELIEVEEMRINPPRTLQRLYLKGRLEKIPTWISQLNNLVRIGLKWSKLRDSPLEILKGLPKLTELQMVDCFTGDTLIFEARGFEKLEILLMEDLSNVNTVVIEEGAMPEMKKISLRKCRELTMLLGVNKLVKVEELTLYDMGEELVARLSINGNDREYVDNIPLIHSFTLRNQNWSFRNLSGPVSLSNSSAPNLQNGMR